ncbi:nuclear transport factor 2 family protein [Pendulispora brunnea]|uniref:Nuclear transport factor 2 family protein n=1 Tax=Pendulispora brunnea TaxID=2905690 RepID=A0ABZ2JUE1_9BACT
MNQRPLTQVSSIVLKTLSRLLVSAALAGCAAQTTQARQAIPADQERVARELDLAHAQAILRGDQAALSKFWGDDFLINNQWNKVDHGDHIKKGTVTYSSFERTIEASKAYGNTVIVMGHETVVPKGTSPDAGKTIHRRYTDIWVKRDGAWQLVARHANVIADSK